MAVQMLSYQQTKIVDKCQLGQQARKRRLAWLKKCARSKKPNEPSTSLEARDWPTHSKVSSTVMMTARENNRNSSSS